MFFLGIALGFVLAFAVFYFKFKSFKTEVYSLSTIIGHEVDILKTQAINGGKLVEEDFSFAEKGFKALFSKF